MNNILTFEDYKKMNIRQVESVIYRQFMEEDIKDEVNEGFIRNKINKAAGKFIHTALADEIEKGKELEESIKEALDGLDRGFSAISQRINNGNSRNTNVSLQAIEQIKDAIKDVQSQTFDTLTMIGSEGEIDFAGFMGSATVSAAANFGILFSPIRSIFITRKAYKYFLGIIKQTIRRNLLIIQLNFDQFENLILQKSFESEEDSETLTIRNALNDIISKQQELLCKEDTVFKKKSQRKELSDWLNNFKKTQDMLIKQNKEKDRTNPFRSLWEDQHNNTYTRTLEQIKQYINEDSQKELDALKNSVTKMAGNDNELMAYGELLLSAAEEYAIKTNHGINNNFIKMSSVFNLENQKKLIELIVEAQKENEREIERNKENQIAREKQEEMDRNAEEGKNIYENKLKDSTEKYTFDKFKSEFDDNEIKCLKAFLHTTDEGKEEYEKLIDKFPYYKYLLGNILSLNTFLSSLRDLKVVEISDVEKFYTTFVPQSQSLYYMMAEKSIKDAVDSTNSGDYFGLLEGKNSKIEENIDGGIIKKYDDREDDINKIISKQKYFLTFSGNSSTLFDILHKDFKTAIFKKDKYVGNISTESKEDIFKIINEEFKLGNSSLTKLFASYLVRLEAHMLLENPSDSWVVCKNNSELFSHFKPKSKKILNKKAFVEISKDDYEEIKSFLKEYYNLYDNDFIINSNEKNTNEKNND
jgi:hypothetical protein